MSEDWKPGDLAVCVDASPCRGCREAGLLVLSQTYTVERTMYDKWAGLGLCLLGVYAPETACHLAGFSSHRFRKVKPDTAEPCEAEFVTLLKRKQVKA